MQNCHFIKRDERHAKPHSPPPHINPFNVPNYVSSCHRILSIKHILK